MKYALFIGCLVLTAQMGISNTEAAAPAPANPVSAANGFTGKVIETTNTSDYTYALIDTGTEKKWAAAPRFQVKVGDTASVTAGMPMPKYHSKTLNRDFDVVYFTDRVSVNGGQPGAASAASEPVQLPKDHPPIPGLTDKMPNMPSNHPPLSGFSGKTTLDVSGIKKAEGGKTVAEVYAEKSKLSGKQVKVRGKVVKYNASIMGKNWLHLRDGTGKEGSNDLLVTSSSPAKVGDTVLATGLVAVNKDFGANYKYPVMVEDAQVKVE